MPFHLLLVKESAPGEKRVGLVPEDIAALIQQGHTICVEAGAGEGAGFSDQDYQTAGATIRKNEDNYSALFDDITLICRAKRPNRVREQAEAKALKPGMKLVGALDPFEPDGHVHEYHQAQIDAYSIDQLDLPNDDPMNVLASMSAIAGELALDDAMAKAQTPSVEQVLIVGTGIAGMAAYQQAKTYPSHITVVTRREAVAKALQNEPNTTVHLMDKNQSLRQQQATILTLAKQVDVVVSSARNSGQKAPVLFPAKTLNAMKPGACIVDLSLSEGGNVEGSHHDKTVELGRGVLVTNTSGYPKVRPAVASPMWSHATRFFIEALANPKQARLVETVKLVKY